MTEQTGVTGIGVIGAGMWGAQHARVFSTLDDTHLVAVCDVNKTAAQELAQQFPSDSVTTDYRHLLDNPKIDAISIATPDFAHATLILDALAAGKHVLTEKPLATNLEEAEHVAEAARSSGLKLMVDFHNRVNPVFVAAQQCLERGELGRVVHGTARLSNTTFVPLEMLSWAKQSSALWFLGSHAVDLLRFLLNDEVVRVYAKRGDGILSSRGVTVPDFHLSMLEFGGGAVLTLENSWVLSPDNPMVFDLRVELVGSDGQLQLNPSHNGGFSKLCGNGMRYDDLFGLTPTAGNRVGGFVLESIARFVDAIRHDAPLLATAEDGLRVTRVLTAIEESAASGVAIDISYD